MQQLTSLNSQDNKKTERKTYKDIHAEDNGGISDARKKYLREYYLKNKEKARQYQRHYNLRFKKKERLGQGNSSLRNSLKKDTFTPSDIMKMPAHKASIILNQILYGDKFLTM